MVCNYGIDCALSQLVYHNISNRDDYTTISSRYINEFLTVCNPKILLGFSSINVKNIKPTTYIIDNTKTSINFYQTYDRFFGGQKVSKTGILLNLLDRKKAYTDQVMFANLADKIACYNNDEQTDRMMDLYDAVGHECFIGRMISNPVFTLNKNEEQIVLRVRKYKEEICKKMISDTVINTEYLYVCKCHFSLQRVLEDMLFRDNEDVGVLVTWDYTPDGDIRVNIKSRGNAANDIAKLHGGYGFNGNGSFKMPIKNNSMSTFLLESIWEELNNNINEFDNTQEEIENAFKNESTSYTKKEDVVSEDDISSIFKGLI